MARDPYDIRKIFEEMTLSLILSMRRNFARHREWEKEEGFRWEQWQSAKLRSIAEYQRRNRMIISKASQEADKLIDEVVRQSFEAGQKRQLSLWDRFVNLVLKPFGKKRVPVSININMPQDIKPRLPIPAEPVPWDLLPEAPPERDFFTMNEKKIQSLQDGIKADLNKANAAAFRKMDDVYRQVIYKTSHYMTAGAKTLDQAVDMATKDFLERGIDCVTYSDGRKVNIASYAEMALRTVSQRATFMGEGAKRDEWGVYTVIMSAHDNCSPWCLPFQGTVMIDDVYTSISKEQALQLSEQTGYMLLSEAMREGAFHPNCRHTLSTFFPGITKVPLLNDELAERNYEAEQKQRYMERQIRKYKRLEIGSLDELNQRRYKEKVKEWQGRLTEYIDDHPELRRDRSREVDKTAI